MLGVLTVVLPVFVLVGAGYAAARFRLIAESAVDGLMAFAVRFAVPVLLFEAMATLDLGQAFDVGLLTSFYAGAFLAFVTGIVGARLLFKRRPGESVVIGFCAMFSNTLLIGVPIMTRAYGEGSLGPVFSIVAIHAPFNYVLGIVTMEASRRDGTPPLATARRAARDIFTNALTIGILAGLAVNVSALTPPGWFMGAVEMMADAALPAALFGLGGALTRYRLRADLREAGMVTAISTMLHPLAALILGTLVFDLPHEVLRAAVIIAAMPTGMNGYIFAAQYQRAQGAAASAVLLATASAVVTASFWLWVVG